jgi:hypothetical protein
MEKMSIINNPFQKAGQQIEAIYASNQHLTIGASNVSQTTALSDRTLGVKRVVESEITSAMLESEAFKIPIDRLVNLWIARFGNDWVPMESIEDDDFFRLVFNRLKQLGEVEVHFLTDRARYVCRMPE